MGMYTQVRGWLNVDSIGCGENFIEIQEKVEILKEKFKSECTIDRTWVCEDTIVHTGGNGSVFIFIGTELKNYGNPAMAWLEFLVKEFPNAEGSVDFQYEEYDFSSVYYIRNGEISKPVECPYPTRGYGNMYK